MSDLQAIEAATGAKLEAGAEYHRYMHSLSVGRNPITLADAALTEAYALIVRLVGERDAERAKFAFYPKTQTAYSEVLHRAKKAEAALANRPIQYEPIPVDESADELVAVLKERDDAKADLAAMAAELNHERESNHISIKQWGWWMNRARELEAFLESAKCWKCGEDAAKLAAAERERDALKCCGNCGFYIGPRYCGSIGAASMTISETVEARKAGPVCRPEDQCHFVPTRWHRRFHEHYERITP